MRFYQAFAVSLISISALWAEDSSCDEGHCYDKEQDDNYAVPPPFYSNEEGSMIFFLNIDYTLWKPYQQGMLVLNTNLQNSNTSTNWIGPQMPLSSGFKVGAGINTRHDGWKLEMEYTWFRAHPEMKAVSLDPNISYFCPWVSINDSNKRVSGMSSEFTVLFNRIDLTLDRTFYIGNYLAFCPWAGLLGAWDQQNFNINITPTNPSPAANSDLRRMRQTMNWWAIGPYAGFDSSYYVIDELAFFGYIGAALNIALHQTNKQEHDAVSPANIITNTKTKISTVEPMVETSLGFRWDYFGKDWGLRLQAGWELQVWFNHNSFIQGSGQTNYSNYSNYGNFSTQGLTLMARVNL
jgi:hypothetical protein